MVAVGVIGVVVLILIYFVLKTQSLSKELKQYKHTLKTSDKQSRNVLSNLTFLSQGLQKVYSSRINSAKKHGLINDEDFAILSTIIENFTFVVSRCSEHGDTVEEAVQKSLENTAIEMQQLNHFIARQPQEVKLPWCKNQLSGYVIACQNISVGQNPKKATSAEASES